MAITVKIRIGGLAVIFREADHWRVIFLCDKKHNLKFCYGRSDEQPSPAVILQQKGREIFIKIDPSRPTGGVTTADNYRNVFNMASLYAHRDNVKLKKPSEMKRMERVDMIIPYAMLYTDEMADPEYEIKIHGSEADPTPLGEMAEIVGGEIVLNRGETLSVTANDAGFPDLPAFPDDGDVTYILYFDNDCGEDCEDTDDFGLYYDLLTDTKTPGLEFRAGRKGSLDRTIKLTHPDGNCDPVQIDPPPPPLP